MFSRLVQANIENEWIERRFPNAFFVSGFELYEVWALGALTRIATTEEYKDDNTEHCAGDSKSKEVYEAASCSQVCVVCVVVCVVLLGLCVRLCMFC